jgi:5-methylcytosine-specific restriction protein A
MGGVIIKSFYHSTEWYSARARVLARDRYQCQACRVSVRAKGAAHVDHIASRRSRPDLSLSLDNLRTLCVSCHSAKTRSMDTATGSGKVRAPRPTIDINGFPEGWR